MARAFCIPGIVALFCAFVLSFLVSISLPFLPALDITRAHFGSGGGTASNGNALTEVRLGIWAPCFYDNKDNRVCVETGHGYKFQVSNLQGTKIVTINPSWTRGLAVHPVATAVTLVALVLSFFSHLTITLLSSLFSFLAALLTLIAFAIDIALYAYLKHQLNKLEIGARTITGPGFWLTFVTLILLFVGGCTVCFGHRRERSAGGSSSYPMTSKGFFSRFRKN